jgi:glycosyltransferase involved in cell wall biosynthesis
MKTIFLIDTVWYGHHAMYFKFFSKTLLELGCRVIALCPKPDELEKWIEKSCIDSINNFYAFEINEPEPKSPIKKFKKTFSVLSRWKDTADKIKKIESQTGFSPDLVFFAMLDNYIGHFLTPSIISRIFPYSWSGLYFWPTHLRIKQKFSLIRFGPLNTDAILKSNNCKAIAVLDEGIAGKLQNKIKKPIIEFPDFTDKSNPDMDSQMIKQIKEKTGKRKIIGLFGGMEKRKGLLTLIEIAKKSKELFFVFAGNFNENSEKTYSKEELIKIKKFVVSDPSNCFFHLKFIPEESQFNAVINSCDVLFAAYKNWIHSSNILIKAAIFEKLVIVNDGYLMAERVNNFNLGKVVPQGNIEKCIEAINLLINKPFKANFEGYKKLHSIEQLSKQFKIILDLLK